MHRPSSNPESSVGAPPPCAEASTTRATYRSRIPRPTGNRVTATERGAGVANRVTVTPTERAPRVANRITVTPTERGPQLPAASTSPSPSPSRKKVPSIPQLAPELTSEILSYISVRALRRCAVVSRSWHAMVVPMIYEDVRIGAGHKSEELCAVLKQKADLAQYVRKIEVWAYTEVIREYRFGLGILLVDILRCCNRLEILEIDLAGPIAVAVEDLLSSPELKELNLLATILYVYSAPEVGRPLHTSLTTLVVTGWCTFAPAAFAVLFSLPSLSSLSLNSIIGVPSDLFRTVMRGLAPQIRMLNLDYWIDDRQKVNDREDDNDYGLDDVDFAMWDETLLPLFINLEHLVVRCTGRGALDVSKRLSCLLVAPKQLRHLELTVNTLEDVWDESVSDPVTPLLLDFLDRCGWLALEDVSVRDDHQYRRANKHLVAGGILPDECKKRGVTFHQIGSARYHIGPPLEW